MAKTEREKLATIFRETTVPAKLEQHVLLAVKSARHREEIISRRFWAIGLVVSILAVTTGLTTGWQAITTSGIFEITQTAITNFNTIQPTDLLLGLAENLPFGSLLIVKKALFRNVFLKRLRMI